MIDREKDKDKDKDKEKDKEKEKNIIKSGFNETKENVKKLMSKDRQHSKASLPTNVEPVENLNNINNNSNINGDVKHSSSSPLVLTKRPSDFIADGGIELTGLIEKSLPDVLSVSKTDGAVSNGSHGNMIVSPFESLNDDSDSDDAIVDHPHQQLSSSSSASVNILIDSNSNKMMGNVQVSQV